MDLSGFLKDTKLINSSNQTPKRIPPKTSPVYGLFADGEHNAKIKELARELIDSREFDVAYPFMKYNNNGIIGEVDLIVERGKEQVWIEVKYRLTSPKLKKAVNQYRQYVKAFPEFNGRAYCVSCNGIVFEITSEREKNS